MARRNNSYFAEERGRNNNPNFYINMKDEDLRRQVKRIIKDIQRANIDDQDLIYFKADKIISACITESWSQWKSAETNKNALMYYINVPLASGLAPYPNVNLYEERVNASNELGKLTNKSNLWRIAYQVFTDIANGADVSLSLSNIYKLDKSLFYDL